MIDREQLARWAMEYGIHLTPLMLEQFDLYAAFLTEYNQKVNLTAITRPEEIAVKHFLDSIVLLQGVEAPQKARLIDVGTGAGFPGVPLKIVRPDLDLTLLDSLQKRVVFLQQLSRQLGQDNRCIHGRGEELGRTKNHRERYDLVTARAVASLPALCEYCLPLVKLGGRFIALKGPDGKGELDNASTAVKVLGGIIESAIPLDLPLDNRRLLVVVKKISQTPPKYPRNGGNIVKSPL